jgi:hypothetical protein
MEINMQQLHGPLLTPWTPVMVCRLLQQDRHKHKPSKTRILSLQSTRCFQNNGQGDGDRALFYCTNF